MEINEIKIWLNNLWIIISPYLSWENAKAFSNSSFFTSLIGALAGAFAGAYTAQRIVEREKARDAITKEIRSTNAAIMLAFDISNSLLTLKKQHVKALKENLDLSREQLIEYRRKLKSGEIQSSVPFDFKADLQSLPLTQHPIDTLRKLVFEQLTVGGRPLSLVASLTQAIEWLNSSIEMRNELIGKFKERSAPEQPYFPEIYFGLPLSAREVNSEYPNTVDGIYSYTDDGIFYSHLLCKDLNEHGKFLAADFKKRFREQAPHINEADFQKAQDSGLMPAEEHYSDWLNCFVKVD